MRSQNEFQGRKAGVLLVAMLASCIAVVSLAMAQSSSSKSQAPGYLGVTTQTLSDELREGLDFRYAGEGVVVNGVSDGSPAERAGIRTGDVITSVGSKPVASSEELRRVVRGFHEGQVVTVKLIRAGTARTVTATLAAAGEERDDFEWETPAPPPAPRAPRTPRAPRAYGLDHHWFQMDDLPGDVTIRTLGRGRLGVNIQDLDDDLGEVLGVASGKGVLVMGVVDDSPAKKAGLRGGDVITRVNDKSVADSDDLVRALREIDEGDTRITVVRKGATRTVTVDLPKRDEDIRRVYRMRTPDSERVRAYAERLREHSGQMRDDHDQLRDEVEQLKREVERLRQEIDRKDGR